MGKEPIEGSTFASVLEDELKALRNTGRIGKGSEFKNEADIARRADLDPATFSTLKNPETSRANVFKVQKYRLQLAVAIGKDFDERVELARRFVEADPSFSITPGDLSDEVGKLSIKMLQTRYADVNIGLPLFFDTAPLIVAEHLGYFDEIGLSVAKLDYVKWPKTLDYLHTRQSDPHRDVDNDGPRISVYNFESINTESDADTVFCFPLAIYYPQNFRLWCRKSDYKLGDDWTRNLKRIFESKGQDLRIIISGEDMKQGVRRAFQEIGNVDPYFVVLDQFDAPEVFRRGLGDLWVGGVAQSMAASSKDIVDLVDGTKIGLPRQFNGLVCNNRLLKFGPNRYVGDGEMPPARRLVLQLLWVWYRAIQYLDESPTNLRTAAEWVTTHMNVYAGELKYQGTDFEEFWQGRKNSFEIPGSAQEMMKHINTSDDFLYREYDRTRYFADEIEQVSGLI